MQKSTQNNSVKGELEEHSMWHLKVHLRFNFKKHKKLQKKMHLTFQLIVHLELQSRVHLWISDLALYVSFIYSAEQTGKQNCWYFRIRVHRRVRMPIRGRGRLVRGGGGGVIYCFSDAIFFWKWIHGRLGIKKIYFISAYVLYGHHLSKKSAINISVIS